MLRLCIGIILTLLLAGGSTARAEAPETKYLRIYNTIEQADALVKRGQTEQAKAKYQEARAALKDFKTINPTWNAKAVSYRLSYVAEKIDSLSQPTASPAGGNGGDANGATTAGALPPGTEIKLLANGAEPRQAFRFLVKPGEAQTTVMTLEMAMSMGGAAMMKIPAIKITLAVQPKSVTPEGDINCEMRLEDIGLDNEAGSAPEMVEAMKASLGGVKGMLIESTISNRGLTKKAEVKLSSDADAVARQAMDQMKDSFLNTLFLLPEEPIGSGAKWVVKQKINVQGKTVDQTTTHQLVSVEGSVLTIESNIEQSAANQKIPNPAMPQLKVDLKKLTGTSKGQMTVDLTKVMPVRGTVGGNVEIIMSAGSGAQAQSMTVKSETNIKIESK